jgi:glycerophosphoryl diester phosphodiesterase
MHPLLDRSRPLVIGHRGNRAHAPENTLEALQQAVGLGVDALEFDLRVSEDEALVVFHDATVDRTTNGRGAVGRHTLRELRALDAGHRFTVDRGRTFPWRGRGIRVPTFDEVLEACPDLPLIVELKTAEASELAIRTIARHRAADRVLLGSFLDAALAPLRGRGVALSGSVADARRLLPSALLRRRVARPGVDALCLPPSYHGVPVPVVGFARLGIPTHVWTVNDPARAVRYWRRGVTGIISDDPGPMLAARRLVGPGGPPAG